MNQTEFQEACREIQIELSEEALKKFDCYAGLLKDWNQKMNLTAITQYEEILEKHFYDSLLASKSVRMDGKLCDVGAGAGFPSLPLKIAFPDLDVTILEPIGKRCLFLNEVVKELNLENVKICNVRAEEAVKELRESFDLVTARAVANLRILSELCIPLVKRDGIFLAMKGAQGKAEDEAAFKAIKTLGCCKIAENVVQLKDESERVNLVYKKIKATPPQYPRMYSKIKKNPL